jgi:hypothetical protein
MIYICWEEIAHEFTGWKYVGNGETVPTMKQTTVRTGLKTNGQRVG